MSEYEHDLLFPFLIGILSTKYKKSSKFPENRKTHCCGHQYRITPLGKFLFFFSPSSPVIIMFPG